MICLGVFPILIPAQSDCDPACGENQHCETCTCPSSCGGLLGYCTIFWNKDEECCVNYRAGGSCKCDEGLGFIDVISQFIITGHSGQLKFHRCFGQ